MKHPEIHERIEENMCHAMTHKKNKTLVATALKSVLADYKYLDEVNDLSMKDKLQYQFIKKNLHLF